MYLFLLLLFDTSIIYSLIEMIKVIIMTIFLYHMLFVQRVTLIQQDCQQKERSRKRPGPQTLQKSSRSASHTHKH